MACSRFVDFLVLLFFSSFAVASYFPHVKRHVSELASHYDYIIAGGGTSGLTVADRLTAAFPGRSVLVVEYGQLINSTDVLRPAATVMNQQYTFQIISQSEPGLNNRSFSVTVGKIVGGCSAINAQMFDRGSAADYDAWGDVTGSEFREAGWTWDGLLPYFKKVRRLISAGRHRTLKRIERDLYAPASKRCREIRVYVRCRGRVRRERQCPSDLPTIPVAERKYDVSCHN